LTNQFDGTLEWYANWLAETRPDLSEVVRLEMAAGFAQQQLPPQPAEADDEVLPDGQSVEELLAKDRNERRALARKLAAWSVK
jgi:hypothetical protein